MAFGRIGSSSSCDPASSPELPRQYGPPGVSIARRARLRGRRARPGQAAGARLLHPGIRLRLIKRQSGRDDRLAAECGAAAPALQAAPRASGLTWHLEAASPSSSPSRLTSNCPSPGQGLDCSAKCPVRRLQRPPGPYQALRPQCPSWCRFPSPFLFLRRPNWPAFLRGTAPYHSQYLGVLGRLRRSCGREPFGRDPVLVSCAS